MRNDDLRGRLEICAVRQIVEEKRLFWQNKKKLDIRGNKEIQGERLMSLKEKINQGWTRMWKAITQDGIFKYPNPALRKRKRGKDIQDVRKSGYSKPDIREYGKGGRYSGRLAIGWDDVLKYPNRTLESVEILQS